MNTQLGPVTIEGGHVPHKALNKYASSPEVRQYIRREIEACKEHQPSAAASERARALEDVLNFIKIGAERPRWMNQQ